MLQSGTTRDYKLSVIVKLLYYYYCVFIMYVYCIVVTMVTVCTIIMVTMN